MHLIGFGPPFEFYVIRFFQYSFEKMIAFKHDGRRGVIDVAYWFCHVWVVQQGPGFFLCFKGINKQVFLHVAIWLITFMFVFVREEGRGVGKTAGNAPPGPVRAPFGVPLSVLPVETTPLILKDVWPKPAIVLGCVDEASNHLWARCRSQQ